MNLNQALGTAQQRANATGKNFEVFEHVGAYGRPEGDIDATHCHRVCQQNDIQKLFFEAAGTWALVAIAEPDGKVDDNFLIESLLENKTPRELAEELIHRCGCTFDHTLPDDAPPPLECDYHRRLREMASHAYEESK